MAIPWPYSDMEVFGARLVFTNEGKGSQSHIEFTPPDEQDNISAAAQRTAVMQVLEGLKGFADGQVQGYAALLALAPGNKNRKADIIRFMKEDGLLAQSAKGKGKTYLLGVHTRTGLP